MYKFNFECYNDKLCPVRIWGKKYSGSQCTQIPKKKTFFESRVEKKFGESFSRWNFFERKRYISFSSNWITISKMCCSNNKHTLYHWSLIFPGIWLWASMVLVGRHAFMRLNCILSHSRWLMCCCRHNVFASMLCINFNNKKRRGNNNRKVYYVHLLHLLFQLVLATFLVWSIWYCFFFLSFFFFLNNPGFSNAGETCATAADAVCKIQQCKL